MAVPTQSDRSAALSCAQFLTLLSAPGGRAPLLIDLRSERRFRRGHIAGSHPIPTARLLSSELPDGELILISERPGEALAVIEALHSAGYPQRLRYLGEGLAGWRRRGLPLELPVVRRRGAAGGVLLPALGGTGLILAAAALSSLPLLGLGLLLLWGPWLEAAAAGREAPRRLGLDS